MTCDQCGVEITLGKRARKTGRHFCSNACRQRNYYHRETTPDHVRKVPGALPPPPREIKVVEPPPKPLILPVVTKARHRDVGGRRVVTQK